MLHPLTPPLPDLNIEAQQHKVYPGTERDVYHNVFFKNQQLVVNALDNVEARRYVDSRCVTNQRPLLESGTMGAKGHVQVCHVVHFLLTFDLCTGIALR